MSPCHVTTAPGCHRLHSHVPKNPSMLTVKLAGGVPCSQAGWCPWQQGCVTPRTSFLLVACTQCLPKRLDESQWCHGLGCLYDSICIKQTCYFASLCENVDFIALRILLVMHSVHAVVPSPLCLLQLTLHWLGTPLPKCVQCKLLRTAQRQDAILTFSPAQHR
eukprot:1151205-Pelagomonas_calceolata.AAC.5